MLQITAGSDTDLTGLIHDITTSIVSSIHAKAGTASVINGRVMYQAPSSGSDILTYTVSDQLGGTSSGSLAVTVEPNTAHGQRHSARQNH